MRLPCVRHHITWCGFWMRNIYVIAWKDSYFVESVHIGPNPLFWLRITDKEDVLWCGDGNAAKIDRLLYVANHMSERFISWESWTVEKREIFKGEPTTSVFSVGVPAKQVIHHMSSQMKNITIVETTDEASVLVSVFDWLRRIERGKQSRTLCWYWPFIIIITSSNTAQLITEQSCRHGSVRLSTCRLGSIQPSISSPAISAQLKGFAAFISHLHLRAASSSYRLVSEALHH